MKIGLIDADKFWRNDNPARRWGKGKADVFPNLCQMKLSAWHKAQGDEVEWYNGMEWYDRVYISKVFSTTPESRECIQASEVIRGGTGYCIKLVDDKEVYDQSLSTELPYEVEHIYPDYSLYNITDTAYGFLSRGCSRGCAFCHVAPKEGKKSHKVANLDEWWRGQKNIVLNDPNLLACPDWQDLLQQLADSKAWVDINQGMDARLITEAKMEILNRVKLKTIHFAWDEMRQEAQVIKGLETFARCWHGSLHHKAQVFVLVNFGTTLEQDLYRIYKLRDMGFMPYVMVYNKTNSAAVYKSLQRWVNNRALFMTIQKFEDYDKRKAKEKLTTKNQNYEHHHKRRDARHAGRAPANASQVRRSQAGRRHNLREFQS